METKTLIEKYKIDRVAFFGLLLVMLVIAQIVVFFRGSISASGPITWSPFGLSVQIPEGKGWLTDKKWVYDQSTYSYVLRGFYSPAKQFPDVLIECRYLLAGDVNYPEGTFRKAVESVDGKVVGSGKIEKNGRVFYWSDIVTKKSNYSSVYYVTTKFEDNRQLDIEISSTQSNPDISEQVAKMISGSLSVELPRAVISGRQIISEIREKGLAGLSYERSKEELYLIKDMAGNPFGFDVEVKYGLEVNRNPYVKAGSAYYIRGGNQQQITSFGGNGLLKEYSWKSETSQQRGASRIIMSYKDDVLSVTNSAFVNEEKRCVPSGNAIAEIFLSEVLEQLISSSIKEAVVDFIRADGSIMPVLIKIGDAENSGLTATLEYLNNANYSDKVFLDSNRQIQKIEVHQNSDYILEKAGYDEVLSLFPEKADFINQNLGREKT